jgi:transcriptional regulator with XRE-family HTH domain
MEKSSTIIQKIMLEKGIKQKDLVSFLGESQSSVAKWLSANEKIRNDMPNTILLKIADFLKISPYYLLGLDEPSQVMMVQETNLLNIPIISHKVSAGASSEIEGIEVFDTLEHMPISPLYFKTPQKAENLRVTQVDGHSMIPMLNPDNYAIFDITQKSYSGDGLYVINFRSILMIKLLQLTNKATLRIISVNKDYESYETDIDDQSVFAIFGKVVKIVI